MASPAQPDLLDHVGPWTEPDYLALPKGRRRIELLDGGLLVSPAAGGRHQRLSSQLWHALGRAAPDWLEVLEAVNVRVAPDRILIPDLVVVTNPGLDLRLWDPTDVAMVVEIVSSGNAAADRAIKPRSTRPRGSITTCGSNSASRDRVRWRTGRNADTTWRSGHRIRASRSG